MKAVILARVSSNEQEFGKSLEAQFALGRQYAQRKGLEVIKEYRIVESSTRGKRKEFYDMVTFVKAQPEPIAIIAHTVDRLQRRFNETVELSPLVQSGKIELHFVSNGLVVHKDSPSSDIMMWDFNVVGARAYILQLKENTKRGLQQKVRDGEWPTKAPIGYLNYMDGQKRKIKVDEDRAPLVKQAFEEYALGIYSVEEIWRRIKAAGLTNTRGGPVGRNTVHKMLKNPFYYGVMNVRGKQLVPHVYQPLIDQALFEKCQHLRKDTERPAISSTGKNFIFKRMLRCGVCGGRITCYTKIKPSGKKYTYLRCFGRSHDNNCTEPQVQENIALDAIEQGLKRIQIVPEIAQAIANHLTEMNRKQVNTQMQTVANVTRALAEVKAKINKLLDLQLNNIFPDELCQEKLKNLQNEQIRLESVKTENTVNEADLTVSVNEVLDLAQNAVDIFKSSNFSQKREIIGCVFSDLQIKEKNLYFLYKKPFDLLVKGSNFFKSYRGRDLNP